MPNKSLYDYARPLLFLLDPEAAHSFMMYGLGVAYRSNFLHRVAKPPADFPVSAFGLNFPNPVGLAAGVDKNAAYLDALGALGFGFVEIGTVTPRPQSGNPKPRVFRLAEHEAMINRLGFNNDGVDALVRNVQASNYHGVLGINIGKNKDTPNERAVDDYLHCLERVYPHASYITVNISSPNTQGLRDLQHESTLRALIDTLREAQERLGAQAGARKPMLLKIAPDLGEPELDAIADVLLAAKVDGVICTNTTIDRAPIASDKNAHEAGGLSGRPLRDRADAVLGGMAARLKGAVPLVGVGGILEGDDAVTKLNAGASLVQMYTGMIYRGPALISECVEEIRRQRGAPDVA